MSEMRRLEELILTHRTAEEAVISKAAFRAILAGAPADRAGIAAATGIAAGTVDALLDGMTGRGLAVVEPTSRRVVGSWGLSAVPTPHRLRLRGRELYAWCALDAVGIPAALAEDATVASSCHHCGQEVLVEVGAGEVARSEPAGACLWLAACQAGRSVVGFT